MKRFLPVVIPLVVLTSFLNAQSLNISGYKVVQANSAVTITLPAGTFIEPGGYVVIGRNQAKAAFETFWSVTLPSNAVYINGFTVVGSNGFPVINGDEVYTLQNAPSSPIDGPTVAMPSSPGAQSIKRVNASAAAGLEASWTRSSQTTGTPGTGMLNTNTGALVISEISDASTFNNEFVELFYDVAAAPKGEGTLQLSPPRWRFDTPTQLRFTFKTQADTLLGVRFRKPSPWTWAVQNITVQPDSAIISQFSDTLSISNIFLAGADSVVVLISGVTSADTTDEFTFDARATTDGVSYLPLQVQTKQLVYGSPRPMNALKQKDGGGIHVLLGKWAVVRGIVTAAQEFGGPSYLQDATAGMAVFDSSVTNNVALGDDVVLIGLVAPFNDLFEFSPCSILEKISEGNAVDTVTLTINQILAQGASEPYEGRLIRINGISSVSTTTWSATGSGTNYTMTDATGTMQVRISSKTNLVNLPAPSGQFDLVGVLGQFFADYQMLPRSYDDVVVEGQGPRIVSQGPYESNITPTSITFSWQTDGPGSSIVRYGATKSYGVEVTDTNKVTNHQVTIAGLWPATVYQVQLAMTNAAGTTSSPNYVVSTSSSGSSGVVNVYFNKSINASVAVGETARTVYLPDKLIARLDSAKFSVDICMYNMSGSVGANIAAALINAKNRGVKVRVIGEYDTRNNAPWTTLKNAFVPVIDDAFDAVNAGAGLMHNKFIVIDNRDSSSQLDDWVWTGSWNTTDPGTNDDLQNSIEIQDKALANAYTIEFNEMWGSETETPNASSSRFGARKLDNTPHLFTINGISVQCFFSPSDRTTNQIVKTLNKAQLSINIALLTFTRSDITNALVAKKNAGLKVRGVIDNRTDTGSQFDSLLAKGIDVRLDVNSGLLHHKYAVIDAESRSLPQYVITGSHNWSSSAENSNNENTLIIESQRIASLYLQEFKARYLESGGADNILVNVSLVSTEIPRSFGLSQNYPNPFNPATTIEVRIVAPTQAVLTIYDILGREVAILMNEMKRAGTYRVTWNASNMPTGIYFYRLVAGGVVESKAMLLIK